MFEEEVTILPGDQFAVECTYDTTEEDDMILFAESTWDEMCGGSVYVYPVPDFFAFGITDFAQSAVDKWLNDAYDLGLWNVDMNGSTVEDLIESEGFNISSPSDIHPNDWAEYGIKTMRTRPPFLINSGTIPSTVPESFGVLR